VQKQAKNQRFSLSSAMTPRFSTVFSTVVEILGGETERERLLAPSERGSGPGDCSTPVRWSRLKKFSARLAGPQEFDPLD
jgi:hypothetical protein